MTTDNRFLTKLSLVKPLKLAMQVSLVCGLTLGAMNSVFAGPREQAKRIHDHLAGIPPTEQVLCAMTYWVDPAGGNDPAHAAMIVMDINPIADPNNCNNGNPIDNSLSKKAFYSVSLKNFVTPWTNEAQTVHADLNDYTALVIGMIRDDKDFDDVLSTTMFYKGTDPSLSAVSVSNNDHFKEMQDRDMDLSDPTVLSGTAMDQVAYLNLDPQTAGADPAGIVTTRAASIAFFTGGTNRLMWRMTAVNYLCRDMEQLKDVSRPPDRIRQDVSRSPGGDSSIYLSSCMGCHAGMDPLAGAYAYYDHEVTDVDVTPDGLPNTHMLWKYNSSMFGGTPAMTTELSEGETLFNANCFGGGCHNATDLGGKPHTATDILNAINSVSRMSSVSRNLNFDAIASYLDNPSAQQPVRIDVTAKYLINSGNFKNGYVTKNDQWTNYWREGQNSDMEWGWRETLAQQGTGRSKTITVTKPDGSPDSFTPPTKDKIIASSYGAASLGYEVTSTKAFAQCQVEKVYKFVCLQDPRSADSAEIESIRDAMPGDNYNMKDVFAKVATMCKGN